MTMRRISLAFLLMLTACDGMQEAQRTPPGSRPDAQVETTEADQGFRWSDASARCEKDGQAGWNPGFLGECGNLSSRLLNSQDLRRVSLKGALLHSTQLKLAVLDEVDLSHATLFQTQLLRASLVRASLVQAQASNADLKGAALDGADLRGADLSHTQLTEASLKGALFDASTRLPFSETEAISRGMIKN